ncbi:MAG: hypothetical protein KatS3mg005_0262 [Bryobacteraceae bacterium]|nr:MAG: hypothetical protein KatS3mg005_0262 [Bryobacteraceae bacterium]
MSLQFKVEFLGEKKIYVRAGDQRGAETEWRELGRWRIADAPRAAYMSPSRASGPAVRYSFVWNHLPGGSPVKLAWIVIGPRLEWKDSCAIAYTAAPDRLALSLGDDQWTVPAVPTAETALASPLCRLLGPSVYADRARGLFSISGTLAFSEKFQGPKKIWMQAVNAAGEVAHWQEMGEVTVTGPNVGPEVASATYSASSGREARIEVEVRDVNGAGDIDTVEVIINDRNDVREACALEAAPGSGFLRLRSDSGTSFAGYSFSSSPRPLENTQCLVEGGRSSIATAGNALRLSLAVRAKTVMAGEQRIFIRARDFSGTESPWTEIGPWLVPPAESNRPPVAGLAGSVTSRGRAVSVALSIQDPDSPRDVAAVELLIGNTPEDPESCWLRYSRRLGRIELKSEDGASWISPSPGDTQLEHAGCSVPADPWIYVYSGALRITLGAAFREPLQGQRNLWARATDASGADSGWTNLGAFSVEIPAVNRPPSAVLAAPPGGTGSAVLARLDVTDQDGYLDVRAAALWFQSETDQDRWCAVAYERLTGIFRLASSDSPVWQVLPSDGASVSTNSCRLLRASTSILSGNQIRVRPVVAFRESMAGPLVLRLNVSDMAGAETGWQDIGQWLVTFPNQPPSAIQIDPATGSGSEQILEVAVRDPEGAQDLSRIDVTLSSNGLPPNACRFFLDFQQDAFGFFTDKPNSFYWYSIGQNVLAQNGQCAIPVRSVEIRAEDGLLRIRAPIQLRAGLSGKNIIRVSAADHLGASYTLEEAGTWTVPEPEPNRAPEAVSLQRTPSGSQERWTAAFSDADGYGHLATLDVRVGDAPPFCGFRYDRVTDTFRMMSDDGASWGNPVPGASGTALENSACSFLPWRVSVSGSGATMNVQLEVTLKQPLTENAAVWMAATDRAGASTGWVKK